MLGLDVSLAIMKYLPCNDIINLISINKDWYYFFKENREIICKTILDNHLVNYKDQESFIHKIKTKKVCIHNPNYYYKLFIVFYYYNNRILIDIDYQNITSIPIFQKVQYLYCNNNKLEKIPKMQQLQYLYCENNNIKYIHYSKNMKVIYCDISTKYLCKCNKISIPRNILCASTCTSCFDSYLVGTTCYNPYTTKFVPTRYECCTCEYLRVKQRRLRNNIGKPIKIK